MTWRQHRDMFIHSVKLVLGSVALGLLALVLMALLMIASVSYVQHRIDVNMARQEMAEVIVNGSEEN